MVLSRKYLFCLYWRAPPKRVGLFASSPSARNPRATGFSLLSLTRRDYPNYCALETRHKDYVHS